MFVTEWVDGLLQSGQWTMDDRPWSIVYGQSSIEPVTIAKIQTNWRNNEN
jgi:hypothetical protein